MKEHFDTKKTRVINSGHSIRNITHLQYFLVTLYTRFDNRVNKVASEKSCLFFFRFDFFLTIQR